MSSRQSGGQKKRGRPKGRLNEKTKNLGPQARAMRDSAISYATTAKLLKFTDWTSDSKTPDRVRQQIDRLERPYRLSARDDRSRQDLGFAERRIEQALTAADEDGVTDVERDPRFLRSFIRFLEAHKAIARAERDTGDYTAWLPLFMRANPVAEIQAEMDRTRATLREVDMERKAARRASADRRLGIGSGHAMTTHDYARLSKTQRTEIEKQYGLEGHSDLRKFDSSYRDDLAA